MRYCSDFILIDLEGCVSQLDVVFVLDISGSVQDEYRQSMALARAISSGFDIDHDLVRVGGVAFSTTVVGQFYMKDNIGNRQGVINSFDFQNKGGSTNTPQALEFVSNFEFTMINGDRPGIQNVVILISDGYSNVNSIQTGPDADSLKGSGTLIYVIGIGSDIQMSELVRVASSPDSQYVIRMPSQADPSGTASVLLDRLCGHSWYQHSENIVNPLPWTCLVGVGLKTDWQFLAWDIWHTLE